MISRFNGGKEMNKGLSLDLSKVMPYADFSEIENTTVVRYLVPWAGEHMINRYKKAIEEQ